MSELIFKNEVFAIIGAAMEVHNELSSGFAEAVYQEAMEIELAERGISFERQKSLRIIYKGRALQKSYIADLICCGQIIVELKCQKQMGKPEISQAINYLRATGLRVAVLINFGDPGRLDWQRVVV